MHSVGSHSRCCSPRPPRAVPATRRPGGPGWMGRDGGPFLHTVFSCDRAPWRRQGAVQCATLVWRSVCESSRARGAAAGSRGRLTQPAPFLRLFFYSQPRRNALCSLSRSLSLRERSLSAPLPLPRRRHHRHRLTLHHHPAIPTLAPGGGRERDQPSPPAPPPPHPLHPHHRGHPFPNCHGPHKA